MHLRGDSERQKHRNLQLELGSGRKTFNAQHPLRRSGNVNVTLEAKKVGRWPGGDQPLALGSQSHSSCSVPHPLVPVIDKKTAGQRGQLSA